MGETLMRTNTVQTFGTSFLDLLSCGMGAVVLLCLIFAASKKGGGDFEGDAAFISIEATGGRVGLRFIPSNGPAVTPGGRGSALSSVLVQPAEPGARSYQLVVDEASAASDKLQLFIFDSDAAPGRARLFVTIESESKRGTSKRTLSLAQSNAFEEHTISHFLDGEP